MLPAPDPGARPLAVYVSSTARDLEAFRLAVIAAIRKLDPERWSVRCMEDYPSEPTFPVEKCLRDVTRCDVYVGLFGFRYGFVPTGYQDAITELEYRTAVAHGKRVVVFLADGKQAAIPPESVDKGRNWRRIDALRKELMRNHTVDRFFRTPDELAGQVVTALSRFDPVADRSVGGSLVSGPYASHAGPSVGTGRVLPPTPAIPFATPALPPAAEFDQLSEPELVELLGHQSRTPDPSGSLLVVHALGHDSAHARAQATAAAKAIGWDVVRQSVSEQLRDGDPAASVVVVRSLERCPPTRDAVALLEQLSGDVPKDQRERAKLAAERKARELGLDELGRHFSAPTSRFRIKDTLGTGLLTTAYRVRERGIDRDLVAHQLRGRYAADPKIRSGFRELYQSVVDKNHTHLAATVGMEETESGPVWVRQFAPGRPLRDVIRELRLARRRPDPRQALDHLDRVAAALQPLHDCGVCHLGVRPSEVFVSDGTPHVLLGNPSLLFRDEKLTAVAVGVDDLVRLADDTRYTAPETLRGQPVPASDFYSLGMMADELFCTSPPFQDADHYGMATGHQVLVPASPSGRGSPFGDAGDAILLKFLKKNPAERYGSVREVRQALAALRDLLDGKGAGGGGGGRPPKPVPPPAPPRINAPDFLREVGGDPDPSSTLDTSSPGRPSAEDSGTRVLFRSSCVACGAPLPESVSGLCPSCAASRIQPTPAPEPSGPSLAQETIPPTISGPLTGFRAPGLSMPAAPPGYQLLECIGRGGMGVVYTARDLGTERVVAMKFLPATVVPGVIDRFMIEVRALARLDHPNIVRVFGCDFYRDVPYFTMEYLPGGSLSDRVRNGGVGVADAVRVIAAVCRAVHFAHTQGVVHRDLKPSNILMAADGTPRVCDFGLAKRMEFDDAITHTGIVGTPAYMAPEQARGGEIGPASDVYGLGATLYYLLTGRAPFAGHSAAEVLAMTLHEPPPSPRAVSPAVSEDLDAVVMRCLEKQPGDRYPSAEAVAEDLERVLAGGPTRARGRVPARWRRWMVRRRRSAVWAAVALAAAVALILAGMALARTSEPRDELTGPRVVEIPAAE